MYLRSWKPPQLRYNSANIYHRGLCKQCKQSLDKCLRMLVSGKGGSWELTINHHIIILHSSLGGFEWKCRSRASFSRRKTWKGLNFKEFGKWILCQAGFQSVAGCKWTGCGVRKLDTLIRFRGWRFIHGANIFDRIYAQKLIWNGDGNILWRVLIKKTSINLNHNVE